MCPAVYIHKYSNIYKDPIRFVSATFFKCIIYRYCPGFKSGEERFTNARDMKKLKNSKIILRWNGFNFSRDEMFKDLKCMISNCIFIRNSGLFNKSDAVIFCAGLGIPKPPHKRPYYNQKWTFMLHESPIHGWGCNEERQLSKFLWYTNVIKVFTSY